MWISTILFWNGPDPMHATLVVFWLCAALVAYTYAGYPLLLLALASVVRRPAATQAEDLSVTVLLAAHNEEASIEAKLQSTLALHYPPEKLQVIVASDGSSDQTDAIVRRFADRGVLLVRIDRQQGKTHAQNVAVQHATGDVIVFSDATTKYHPNALRHIAGNYADPGVGGVSGRYIYVDPTQISPNGLGARSFSSYDNLIRTLQSRVWTISGCCGCIYSVRRVLYTPLAHNIISDLVQPLHILRQGFRVTLEPRALAYEETTNSPRQEFRMRVRVIVRAMVGLLSVPEMLMPWHSPWTAFQLWSHKILRWCIPFFLAGLFISSALLLQSPFFRVAFGLQLALYTLAFICLIIPLHRRWKVFGLPLYFCTINAAAVAGFVQLLCGQRYVTWQPLRK